MGDAENALPASKKRAAGREISRDNPGLDDDDDTTEQEVGTFKKASDEVLAARRIVKVKRNPTPASASSNPFANISLIPPKAPTEDQPVEKPVQEETQEVESINKEETGSPEETKETEGQESKKDTGNGESSSSPSTTPLNSFQQLSSNQNAFTGIAGTGFSTSTFSFGSLSNDGSGSGSGSGFPSFNFGSSNNGGTAKPEGNLGNSSSSLQEKPIETGEENEKAVFTSDAVLFEYLDGGWKERGKGELKLNVSTSGVERARLVMRARGNYRLILNASLFADMKLANMEKKGVSFACVNSTGDEKSGNGLTTFALKFKDGSIVEEFRGAVMEHKGKKETLVVKTPENSPKASDE